MSAGRRRPLPDMPCARRGRGLPAGTGRWNARSSGTACDGIQSAVRISANGAEIAPIFFLTGGGLAAINGAAEPRTGVGPEPVRRARGDVEDAGRLGNRQA